MKRMAKIVNHGVRSRDEIKNVRDEGAVTERADAHFKRTRSRRRRRVRDHSLNSKRRKCEIVFGCLTRWRSEGQE